MNITIIHGLPFVRLKIGYCGKELLLDKVLLDTGSAGTIFNANVVGQIGVFPEENDVIDAIRGIGGVEYVYTKIFDEIQFDDVCLKKFQVEIGDMDYGMILDGIIGFDFISSACLVIDSDKLHAYRVN